MGEIPVWAGIGMLATVLLIIGIVIAWLDGVRAALTVIGLTIAGTAVVFGIIAFWAWIGGAL